MRGYELARFGCSVAVAVVKTGEKREGLWDVTLAWGRRSRWELGSSWPAVGETLDGVQGDGSGGACVHNSQMREVVCSAGC